MFQFGILYYKKCAKPIGSAHFLNEFYGDLTDDAIGILDLVGLEVAHRIADAVEGFSSVEDIAATEGVVVAEPSADDDSVCPLVEDKDDIVAACAAVGEDGVALRTHTKGHIVTHIRCDDTEFGFREVGVFGGDDSIRKGGHKSVDDGLNHIVLFLVMLFILQLLCQSVRQ